MKTWNLGNTTLRNPWRIREGLRLLKELFETQDWDEAGQRLFYQKLVERGLLEPEGGMPSPTTQGINGRKWAAAPNQLGLARAWAQKRKGPVVITPAGEALLAADEEQLQQEVFLRQLLKYRIPSPIEHGSKYEDFEVMPFRLTLRVVYELHRRGLKGITKEEIALFLITTIRDDGVDQAIRRITEFREERDKRIGLVTKRRFFQEARARRILELFADEFSEEYRMLRQVVRLYKAGDNRGARRLLLEIAAGGKGSQTKRAQQFFRETLDLLRDGGGFEQLKGVFDRLRVAVQGGTLSAYADTTVRYSAITSLFSISGDKMVLVEERLPLVERLVAEGSPAIREEESLPHLYSADVPRLPTDDLEFLRGYVKQLERRRTHLGASAAVEPAFRAKEPPTQTLLGLKAYRLQLEAEIAQYREEIFYRDQARPESIGDIREYLDRVRRRDLLGGETYLPAFLEWTVWRIFLAINQIASRVSDTRNFKIDEEIFPVHHAKGGVADMVFRYRDFVLVVEVTLNASANQWSTEAEPVPRHVADVMVESDLPVYAVFVAPRVHPQTAQQFFNQTYHFDGEFRPLDIVPMTLDQLERLLTAFDSRRFGPSGCKDLLEEILQLKADCSNGLEWLKKLSEYFNRWVNAA